MKTRIKCWGFFLWKKKEAQIEPNNSTDIYPLAPPEDDKPCHG